MDAASTGVDREAGRVDEDAAGTTTAPPPRRERRLAGALVGIALLPYLVGLVVVWSRPWQPTSDWAWLELRVADVGTAQTPLVGPYSRYGWDHPGPLLFWLLALPYRLLGTAPRGLLVGALLVNAAAVAILAWLAWRRGGVGLVAWALLVAAVLTRALGASLLRDPWNPHVTMLPLLVFVFAVWCFWCGDRVALPIAVGIGGFLVQSHLGYGLEVVVLLLVGLGSVAWARRRDRGTAWREWRPSVLMALAVGTALGLAPLLDQVAGTGNLSEVASFVGDPTGEPVGFATAARLVSAELGPSPPWVTGTEPLGRLTTVPAHADRFAIPVALLALVAAGLAASLRGARDAVRLCVVAGVTAVTAVVSVARIIDLPLQYLVRWLWVVGAVCWMAVGCGIAGALGAERRRRTAHFVLPALGVGLIVTSAAMAVDAVESDAPLAARTAVVDALLPSTRTTLGAPADAGQVLIEHPSSADAQGLAAALARHGYDVRFDADVAVRVGDHREVDGEPDVVLRIGRGAAVATLDADPTWRLVVAHDTRSSEARAALDALPEAVRRNLTATLIWLRALDARDLDGIPPAIVTREVQAALVDLYAAVPRMFDEHVRRDFLQRIDEAVGNPPVAVYRRAGPRPPVDDGPDARGAGTPR